jgi:hypothetical protein
MNIAGEQIGLVHKTLTTVLTGLASNISPPAAGADPVSQMAAAAFATHAPVMMGTADVGLGYLQDGSNVVMQVGRNYQDGDLTDGASVSSSASGLRA